MKAAKIVFVLVITVLAINFLRGDDHDFPLPQVLPFLGGHDPAFYDLGGIVLIALMVWGLGRLKTDSDSNDESSYQNFEDDSDLDETDHATPEDEDGDGDEDE